MIAIIVLFVLAVVAGLTYALAAILVAIFRATVRCLRRVKGVHPEKPLRIQELPGAEHSCDGEFMRIVSSEWPQSFQGDEGL